MVLQGADALQCGREAALRLRTFGPRCLLGVNRGGSNPRGLFDRVLPVGKLDTALPETDILILSLPGTAETRGLLDARRLDFVGAVLRRPCLWRHVGAFSQ